VTFGRSPPNNAEALKAVRQSISQGTDFLGMTLPTGLSLSKAIVRECVAAAPQNGFRCTVGLVTEDVPVIGGFAVDVQLRFMKQDDGDGRWSAVMQ
jgi:hypothetical protein